VLNWIKFYLPVFAVIVVVVCFLIVGRGCFEDGCPPGICAMATEEACFKPAPDPVYTVEKDYGYVEDVPCGTNNTPNGIIKTWQNGGTRYIFVDRGKDGTCDDVVIWFQPNREQDAWELVGIDTCEETERNIKSQIKFKESLEAPEE